MTAYEKGEYNTMRYHCTAPHRTEMQPLHCSRYLMYSSQKTRNQQRVGMISFHFAECTAAVTASFLSSCEGAADRRQRTALPTSSSSFAPTLPSSDFTVIGFLLGTCLLADVCMYVCMIIDYMYDTYVYPEGLTVKE
jgi:hypothetical protein